MKQGTQHNLIADLKEYSLVRYGTNTIIERAENGDYHDFKSEIPMPKMMLFRDLKLIGLDDLAEKSMAGNYDELV